jgi:hypothetical protein
MLSIKVILAYKSGDKLAFAQAYEQVDSELGAFPLTCA